MNMNANLSIKHSIRFENKIIKHLYSSELNYETFEL